MLLILNIIMTVTILTGLGIIGAQLTTHNAQ